jgi:hypothetical protein
MPPYRFDSLNLDSDGHISRGWVDEGRGLTGRLRAVPDYPPLACVEVTFISLDSAGTLSPVYDSLEDAQQVIRDDGKAIKVIHEATNGHEKPQAKRIRRLF